MGDRALFTSSLASVVLCRRAGLSLNELLRLDPLRVEIDPEIDPLNDAAFAAALVAM